MSEGNVILDGKTVPHAYLRRVQLGADRNAYLVKRQGSYSPVRWKEVHEQVLGLFGFFRDRKLERGDRVCILSNTRPEWNVCDIAIQASGLVTVPIYQSSLEEDAAFILDHCEAKLVFAEDEAQCHKLAKAFRTIGRQLPVVVYSDPLPRVEGLELIAFGDAVKAGGPELQGELEKSVQKLEPKDMASIVYTSGTTGRPKGAVLTQGNFTAELRAIVEDFKFRNDDTLLTFLPCAHILARMESLCPIFAGMTMAFAENVNTVAQNMQEVRPTILVSVPRIYEKVYAKIQAGVDSGPPAKKKLFQWAMGLGRQVARARANREAAPLHVQLQFLLADKLVFSKVRERMGGRIRMTISGGAPLAGELCEFFHACGIPIMEGYGLTETTAAVCVNRPEDFNFGSVGKPFAGTEFQIAADGEILVRGPVVFSGYYRNEEATKECFSAGGWFHTGDIGEFNARGMLRITDRKKELIVTSAGKNIAPQKLENLLKQIRFVSNAMVYGDKQKYLVAVITPNEDEVKRWARTNGMDGADIDQIVRHQGLLAAVESEIKSVNQSLASFETIKKFYLLPKDFTVETGELTPSLKIKRKVVIQKFGDVIQQMYA